MTGDYINNLLSLINKGADEKTHNLQSVALMLKKSKREP
jgi:hypothetical protein